MIGRGHAVGPRGRQQPQRRKDAEQPASAPRQRHVAQLDRGRPQHFLAVVRLQNGLSAGRGHAARVRATNRYVVLHAVHVEQPPAGTRAAPFEILHIWQSERQTKQPVDTGAVPSSIVALALLSGQFSGAAVGILQRPSSDAVDPQLVLQTLELLAQPLHRHDVDAFLGRGVHEVIGIEDCGSLKLWPVITGIAVVIE